MLSFLSTALTYLVWGLRVLLIPQFESNINIILPYWIAAYIFAMSSVVFLDLAIIKLVAYKYDLVSRIFIILIVLIYIILVFIFLIGFDVGLVIFMDVTDLTIKNQIIFIYILYIVERAAQLRPLLGSLDLHIVGVLLAIFFDQLGRRRRIASADVLFRLSLLAQDVDFFVPATMSSCLPMECHGHGRVQESSPQRYQGNNGHG